MKIMMMVPNRVLGILLIANMLMATRISSNCSIHPLLKRAPRSLLSRKQFPKSYPCPLWSSSFSFCLHTLHKSTSRAPSLSRYCSALSAPSMAAATVVTRPLKPTLLCETLTSRPSMSSKPNTFAPGSVRS
jgi:oligopeptidase A